MFVMDYIKLMRPYQWYKNLVVFLALFFSGMMLELDAVLMTIFGFILLSCVSSANYALNDAFDAASDRLHPEKKKRPIASGKIKVHMGILFGVLLLSASLIIALGLSLEFAFLLLVFFALTLAYSLGLKDEPYLDVMLIGLNFVLRAVAGALIISVYLSPWLIIGTFFGAIFLAFSKRLSELVFLGEKAYHHRKVLKYYSTQILSGMMFMSAGLLIISFTLYSFIRQPPIFLVLLPIMCYILFRLMHLSFKGSKVARELSSVIYDSKLLFSGVIFVLIAMVILYAV